MNLFSPAETVGNYAVSGAAKTRMPWGKLLILAMLAGFFIALGAAASSTAAHSVTNVGLARLISGAVFPFGLVMVILMGAELFTGNCLLTIPVLEHRATVGGLLRNWAFVYAGNFLGALFVAAVCVYAGQMNYSDGGLAVCAIKTAAAKCSMSFGRAFLLGVMCNLLVTTAVLQALSAKDLTGRAVGAYIPVFFFVVCGFEHSVANMFYVPAGLFALTVPAYAAKAAAAGVDVSALTWGGFLLNNLLPVTLGNILGGGGLGALAWLTWLRKSPSGSAARGA